jgi:hypothetical protein
MRTRIGLFAAVLGIVFSSLVFAQSGRIQERINVGPTPLSQGDIKIGERLTTRSGDVIEPGLYRISVNINTLAECQFILSPYKLEFESNKALEKNAMNTKRKLDPQSYIAANIQKNLLVKGMASNIDGAFSINNITPSEAVLSFSSKQFASTAVLGRSLDSKLVDLVPTFMSLEESSECGPDCIEGYLKVTVRNDGNTVAAGKWNVMLLDPQVFIGTVSDIPPAGEKTIVSAAKIKLPCCNPAVLDAEVHADFYNSTASDSNDSNNTKRFTLKLKQ